jgi:hypothetical protein
MKQSPLPGKAAGPSYQPNESITARCAASLRPSAEWGSTRAVRKPLRPELAQARRPVRALLRVAAPVERVVLRDDRSRMNAVPVHAVLHSLVRAAQP